MDGVRVEAHLDRWVQVGSEFPVTLLGKKFYAEVIRMDDDGVDLRLAMPVSKY